MTQRTAQHGDRGGEKRPCTRRRLWVALAGTVLLVIVLEGLTLVLSRGSGYDLTLKLSTPQREYNLGDEIPITLTLENKGKQMFPQRMSRLEEFIRLGLELPVDERRNEFGLIVRKPSGSLSVSPQALRLIGETRRQDKFVRPKVSLSWTTSVNECALMSEAGVYTVVGVFGKETDAGLVSEVLLRAEPLEVVVRERTRQEMGEYIDELLAKHETTTDEQQRLNLLTKLVYTRDSRIVPKLLEMEYAEKCKSLIREAFRSYLPMEKGTKEVILGNARKYGITVNILEAMERCGCSEEEMREAIAVSLASDDYGRIRDGLRCVLCYPHNSHIARLSELAVNGPHRSLASYPLACNGSEAAVSALRQMLENPDQEIRDEATSAIEWAYRRFETCQGVRAVPSGLIRKATDENSPGRWESIAKLSRSLTRSQVTVLEKAIENPTGKLNSGKPDKLTKIFTDLLKDRDSDVRGYAITLIRFARPGCTGQPLKPGDFPEIYEQAQQTK